jgi:hypothetical protein
VLAIPSRISRSLPSAILAIVPVVCLAAAGCGSSAPPGGTATPGEPGAASQAAGPPAAASTKGIGLVDPDTLDSYRMKTTTWEKGDDKSTGSIIQVEWMKAQKAKRTTMGQGPSAVEMIAIGDKTYARIMGTWVQQPAAAPSAQSKKQTDEIMRQLSEKYALTDVGRETVNGVPCRKVTYSGESTINLPEGPMRGDIKASGQGTMWIADQPGLPAVVVRNHGESATTIKSPTGKGDVTIAMSSEMELTDINKPIVIQAPEGAMIPPTGAATRSGVTTAAAAVTAARTPAPDPDRTPAPRLGMVAATLPPSAQSRIGVSADTFTDEFNGSYNRRWRGTPGVEAEVTTGARNGFLHFTAGPGNDLFPATNLNAPTLWRLVTADFTAETAVEFAPDESYQGAGLFAWQDQDNFVRLERCFGGVGGGGSGICLLQVENGEPKPNHDGGPQGVFSRHNCRREGPECLRSTLGTRTRPEARPSDELREPSVRVQSGGLADWIGGAVRI